MDESTTLTKKLSIPELVEQHQLTVKDLTEAHRLTEAASARINAAFSLEGATIYFRDSYGRAIHGVSLERILSELRRSVWVALVERLELRRFLSVKAYKALSDDLKNKDPLPVTEETVSRMVEQYQSQLGNLLEESIRETYSWLRPRNSKLKTNSVWRVGEKVILENVVVCWGTMWHISEFWDQHLTSLENVFNALDGKGQISKQYRSDLAIAIMALKGKTGSGETALFAFKVFRNGNVHLKFLRPDLVLRFNQIAGAGVLGKSKAT